MRLATRTRALGHRVQFITATEGTTPAFIREVLRRAALLAAERGDSSHVTDELLSAAVQELSEASDQLTTSLLGGPPVPDSVRCGETYLPG